MVNTAKPRLKPPPPKSRTRRKGHDGTRIRAWARVYGTVYNIRCQRRKPRWWRSTDIGYVGMTARTLEERAGEHLYGWNGNEPKTWNYLAPGFDPAAKTLTAQRAVIKAMIETGIVSARWQPHRWRWSERKGFYRRRTTCYQWHLKLRESWYIATQRPRFNDKENANNPRRVTKEQQIADREAWEAGMARRDLKWNKHATSIHVLPGGKLEYSGVPLAGENHERMLRIATWRRAS